jgi:hypothetical protein
VSTGLQPSPPLDSEREPAAPRPPGRAPFPSPSEAGGIAVAVLVLLFVGGGGTQPASATPGGEWVEAVSSPLAVIAAIAALALWLRVVRLPSGRTRVDRPSLARRMGAVAIDFYVAGMMLSSVAMLLALALEARRTGAWAWSFGRPPVATGDAAAMLAGMVLILGGVVVWMAWPASRGRQSVGGYILGVRLERVDDVRPSLDWAVLHVCLGFLAQCVWPVTLLSGADGEGRYWNDRAARSRVVRVDPGT